ncbi:MAG TPA: outer membrane beta-barrel domain-containing protein [Pseudobdellovibrionaceae bacterium]|nr:outer membrane beta-barrel domain-containing protein [Pseudobdellovibrionaceae bacterium]
MCPELLNPFKASDSSASQDTAENFEFAQGFATHSQLQHLELILIDARRVLWPAGITTGESFGWSVRDNMGIRGLRRAGYEVVLMGAAHDAEAKAHAEELNCAWLATTANSTTDLLVEVCDWILRRSADRPELAIANVAWVTDQVGQFELGRIAKNQRDVSLGAIVGTASTDHKTRSHHEADQVPRAERTSVELNLTAKSGQGALLELCHLLLPIRLRRQTHGPTSGQNPGRLRSWLVAGALGAFLQAAPALAQVQERIRFPEEELATESVLPVFDQPVSVKARNVELASRLELGVQGGYAMTEPFFNPLSFGVSLAYHFNEEWGAQLMYNTQMQGLSSEASQLNPIPNTNPPVNANLQYAPAPKAIAIANVQYSAYYGKISLSKEMVMNLHLFGLAGAGMITLGDVQKPLLTVGLGQKFYFSENMSFRFDLRLLAYQGPDPTSIRLDNKFEPQPSSAFSNRVFIEGFLTAGLSYALPAF